MTAVDDFMDWVTDRRRTTDQLFTVELLLEGARARPGWPFSDTDASFAAQRERAKERWANPGYAPSFHHDELRALAERRDDVRVLVADGGSDRPLSDLEALRFFPAIQSISISRHDVADCSPVAALPGLTSLSLSDFGDLHGHYPLDLAELGEMRVLKNLYLHLRHAWPDLRALGRWPALEHIHFSGNLLMLEEVESLPAARVVTFSKGSMATTPLRDLRRLCLLPAVRTLKVDGTASLEGIERFPSAVNFHATGYFRDVRPLVPRDQLTAVTLESDFVRDVAPLSQMKNLRELHLVREWPVDLAPLAEAPRLRRVQVDRCSMMRMEVASLNAGLLPEAEDFRAEVPRTLPPLKFFLLEKENKLATDYFNQRALDLRASREKFYDGDAALEKAEVRSFGAELQAKMDGLLGRGWGLIRPGPFIQLKRFADTSRVRLVVELLRAASAQLRFPSHFTLIVEPHGDMSEEMEEMTARDAKTQPGAADEDWLAEYYEPEAVLRENEEQRQARRERYEFIQREHLRQLHGEEVDPFLLFLPEDHVLETSDAPDAEDEELLSPANGAEDDGDGNVTLAPPPPAPPETESLGEDLMYYLDVWEDCITVFAHWSEQARYNLGQAPEVWTPEAMTRES